MKFGIINGSHRANAQSAKVAAFLADTLLAESLATQVWRLDLADQPLPFWDEGVWDKTPEWQTRLEPLSRELAACDALVIISPEWHGMVPAALKNFFLMWGNNELAHKPGLIVAVSSGTGGAYPVAELRMSSYKNSRLCYIPEQLIIRKVEEVLNPQGPNNPESDSYYRERAGFALRMLHNYAQALRQVRENPATFDPQFKNGM
jgi:NAD(P)H-dependent FMN reductase